VGREGTDGMGSDGPADEAGPSYARAAMALIDPLDRWRRYGEKPDYAGLLTFGGAPYTEDPADLRDADVAVIGAPMDDLVSDRPGARFAPRAIRAASCPPGPHLEAGIDAFEALRIVDFGDAPCIPADPRASHAAIEATVGQALEAGVVTVVLGGDHSIAEPTGRAYAGANGGPVGLIHFDAHTDTGETVFGATLSHGTPMRRLVDDGHVAGERYVQIGLRGYWPGDEEFGWQAQRGITAIRMHEVRRRGIDDVVAEALRVVGDGPAYLSVDVDVLEPALLGPGGMAAHDLLDSCRRIGAEANLVGAEVVEVIPTAPGSADLAALMADRVVREVLTGIALRRRG
jgi:agmatinase